jgi:hypothetical protein
MRKREKLGYNVQVRDGGCLEEVFVRSGMLRASSECGRIFYRVCDR